VGQERLGPSEAVSEPEDWVKNMSRFHELLT
jgi:hypothetical protein